MKKLDYNSIPKYTNHGNYCVSVDLGYFKETIQRYIDRHSLELNPDFQRGHIWTEEQQIKFIEFFLRGGKVEPIRFNHTKWGSFAGVGEMVCVDGLQRTTAFIKFLDNELAVFDGYLFSEIENIPMLSSNIEISVNNLKTKKEVVQWYIELNEGGTPHTNEEISRVKNILKEIEAHENLDNSTL